jgi:hypothetical protein
VPYGDGRELGLTTADHLSLQRCPHCNIANPNFGRRAIAAIQPGKPEFAALTGAINNRTLQWHIYLCSSCGGLAAAATLVPTMQANAGIVQPAVWIVPAPDTQLSKDIPASATRYLNQARETLSSPSASVLMSAAAVDALLKERGYRDGSLYSRIEKAQGDHLLTAHMAQWAHDVRLDANDERHADEDSSAKTADDANRCLQFSETLADLLFVLPARVKRGLKPPPPALPKA